MFSFLFFASVSLFAQNKSIIGKIVSGKKPLLFSNIVLHSQKDTLSAVKMVVSDSVGNFKIEDLNNDSYVINIEHLGYLPKIVRIKIDNSKTNFDLNEINLIAESTTLETVKIVSNRKLIKKTTQGFIIKAKDNIAQAGGTATDLLRNTPTVVVDPEGGISIRGKKPLILINNRRSSLSNTDRIPASSIESIEIINNPSAQYDADSEGGIINIKLKKNTANGTNGSLALGAGFGTKGRANSSFIINHSNKKWNFGLGYDNRFAARIRKADSKRINFLQPNDYYVDQFRNDDRFEITQNLKLNIDYALNEKNNFGIEIIANRNGEDNNETQNSTVKNQNNVFNYNNSRFSNELARENGIETNLNYTRKFNNTRKLLTVNFTSILDFDTENTNIDVTNFDSAGQISGYKTFEKTHNYSNGKEYTLQFDYSFPINKNGIIDIGFKSIFRKTSADFVAENFVNTSYVINPLATNTFNFEEQIHASYVQFRSFIGDEQSTKFKYDFGIRLEKVTNQNQPTATTLGYNRNYFNYFPTANAAYYFKPTDFLKINVSKRINRPGLEQLNPFVDITDALNTHSGNPNLKPEIVNAVEFGYNKEYKQISFSTNVFYRNAKDIIKNLITLQSGGVTNVKPDNFGKSESYGFESITTFYPLKLWSSNLSFSIFQQKIEGSNLNGDTYSNVQSWNGKFINTFTIFKEGKLQIINEYNSPIATPQGTRVAVNNMDIGYQQKIFHNRIGFGIVVTDLFNTRKSGFTASSPDFDYYRNFKIDTRAVLVTFAYTFGTKVKEEMMENKFSNE